MKLTVEELHAAARLAGGRTLAVFAPRWAPDELDIADAVALRVLLARGLAEVRATGEMPELTDATRQMLRPLLDPHTVVEGVRDAPVPRRLIAVESADGVLLAEERLPCVWELRRADPPADRALLVAVSAWLDDSLTGGTVRTLRHPSPDRRVAGEVTWPDRDTLADLLETP